MNANDSLIVALDFPSRETALSMVDLLGSEVIWYKVGLELYLSEGSAIVQELAQRGKRVFLDLKLHDIPNTVAAAVRSAAKGASLLTVHAAGGPAMLQSAAEAASAIAGLRLLAVTVLTSMDEAGLSATGVNRSSEEQVTLLGHMALQSGAHGLICSPREIDALRALAGEEPLLVVPGIRSGENPGHDQRRTASAATAIHRGASMIVVGRPITQATDPLTAVRSILDSIRTEHAGK